MKTRTPSRRPPSFRRLASVVAMALILQGCASRPEPFNADKAAQGSKDKIDKLVASEDPVRGELSLYEAMARALKYNLDHKIELSDELLKQRQLELSNFDMLPTLVGSSGFNGRNNPPHRANEPASRATSF
jgi:hypothetical protein